MYLKQYKLFFYNFNIYNKKSVIISHSYGLVYVVSTILIVAWIFIYNICSQVPAYWEYPQSKSSRQQMLHVF
uniref:Uncharacterized protein n=1 Tax=Myoviridae sp. ctZ2t4 TaxID=2827693 RepID=A0A8S5SS43_9CAUD|nr:MAG TPA: hypothetical protein [Myoviridae sp. ctZ2t4]